MYSHNVHLKLCQVNLFISILLSGCVTSTLRLQALVTRLHIKRLVVVGGSANERILSISFHGLGVSRHSRVLEGQRG